MMENEYKPERTFDSCLCSLWFFLGSVAVQEASNVKKSFNKILHLTQRSRGSAALRRWSFGGHWRHRLMGSANS